MGRLVLANERREPRVSPNNALIQNADFLKSESCGCKDCNANTAGDEHAADGVSRKEWRRRRQEVVGKFDAFIQDHGNIVHFS